MIEWDEIGEQRPTVNVTVIDTDTAKLIGAINGLAMDSHVSFLLECIQREAGLPCRPQLKWDDKVLFPWDTVEEAGVTDGAEIQCTVQQALVTASHDGLAKIWNMETGECETTLTGHQGKVLAANFSPDGRLVVTASEDHTAKVWNSLTGKCIRTLTHLDAVYCATFSVDGKLVVTASEDTTAKIWVVKTGDCKQTLRGHSKAVYSCVFTETQVMTESRDGTTRLWDPKTGVCDRTLEEQAGHYAASYAPNGRHVATTPGDFTAVVLDTGSGEVELTLMGHEDLVISAQYCPTRPPPESPKLKKETGASAWKSLKETGKTDDGAAEDND